MTESMISRAAAINVCQLIRATSEERQEAENGMPPAGEFLRLSGRISAAQEIERAIRNLGEADHG